MALKDWKFTKVDKFRDLWTKGEFVPGKGYSDWIHIDDLRKFSTYQERDDNFEVGAKRKINPKTINGHFRLYKTKSQALKFAKRYMRTH